MRSSREEQDSSLFLFFQGHPEYDADSLLREYRRDIGRFLRGERERYPAAPQDYFSDEAKAVAEDFRTRAVGERDARLIADFPMGALDAGLANTWRRSAIGIYRNWIDYLKDRKAERRPLADMERRSRRGGPLCLLDKPDFANHPRGPYHVTACRLCCSGRRRA